MQESKASAACLEGRLKPIGAAGWFQSEAAGPPNERLLQLQAKRVNGTNARQRMK